MVTQPDATYLQLAPLSVLADELDLHLLFLRIRENSSGLLQDLSYKHACSAPLACVSGSIRTIVAILESPLNVLNRCLLQMPLYKRISVRGPRDQSVLHIPM